MAQIPKLTVKVPVDVEVDNTFVVKSKSLSDALNRVNVLLLALHSTDSVQLEHTRTRKVKHVLTIKF